MMFSRKSRGEQIREKLSQEFVSIEGTKEVNEPEVVEETKVEDEPKASVLKRVNALIADVSSALEDVVNREMIIDDHQHAADALMDILDTLQDIERRMVVARLHGNEVNEIYGPVMPGEYGKYSDEKNAVLCFICDGSGIVREK